MGLETTFRRCRSQSDRGRRWPSALWLVPTLFAAAIGCSGGGGTPGRGDLPALLVEAAPSDDERPFEGSAARRAVLEALRKLLAAEKQRGLEIGRLFGRPQLHSYLLRDESFIGGTFPLGAAELLREVHELETKLLGEHQEFPKRLSESLAQSEVPAEDRQAIADEIAGALAAQRRPVLAAIEAHQKLVTALAELYELVGSDPESLRAMRTGLEFADSSLEESFDAQVEKVNAEIESTKAAVDPLDADQKLSLHWMRVPEPRRR